MSAKTGKRPLRTLSPNKKLEAIQRVHDGESKASVARDIGVPESTLRGWCKNEEKISYLSRKSSDDTSETSYHSNPSKKTKYDGTEAQPFNLSVKPSPDLSVHNYNNDNDANTSKGLLNLNTNGETLRPSDHITEKEKNKVKLARLGADLGLNRPEMFHSLANETTCNFADLSAPISSHWNRVLLQHLDNNQSKNRISKSDADECANMTSSKSGLLTTVEQELCKQLLNDKKPVHESLELWLNQTNKAMLSINQNSMHNVQNSTDISMPTATLSTTSMVSSNTPLNKLNGSDEDCNPWLWKMYKFLYEQHQQQFSQVPHTGNKPNILYQQLTKETQQKDNVSYQQKIENLSLHKNKEKFVQNPSHDNISQSNNNNKLKSTLDNLLCYNKNVVAHQKNDKVSVSKTEAIQHGEKFLEWLVTCSDPSVTAMQIMQFKTLLNNVKVGGNRKNGNSVKVIKEWDE